MLNYAGFWVRFLAVFLDLLILGSVVLLMFLSIAGFIALNGREHILHDRLAVSLFYGGIICMATAYYILMESGAQGATFGKRWLNIKVLDTSGHRLSASRASARLLAHPFSYLLLMAGLLMQPLTRRKQALHDMLAGTVVVRANDSTKISLMASLLVLFFALMAPVLALFATAGLPVYQQHILKVQMDKGMQAGSNASLAVANFYRNNGRVPSAISDIHGNSSHSPHVAGIDINQLNGELTVTFSETTRKTISNKHLLFTPALEADQSISWKCHSNDIEVRILPVTCK